MRLAQYSEFGTSCVKMYLSNLAMGMSCKAAYWMTEQVIIEAVKDGFGKESDECDTTS